MDIEICAPETLKYYPNLENQLREWVNLSAVSTDGLLIRILCGSFLQPYYDWVLWKLDPRGMRLPRIAARYKPGIIEMDIALGQWRPRLETIVRTFYHELGHHKDYLDGKMPNLTEKSANTFTRVMMKRWREGLV